MNLTDAQRRAVAAPTEPRDTCVVAGPGSGKTTVLVEHFAGLVAGGIDPLRILAITFTDKAAGNMRERLAQLFQDSTNRAKLERAYVSTVHGFCARLLKENAVFAGIDPDFYVMDERESLRLQQDAAVATLDDLYEREPDRIRALMRGLAAVDTAGELLGVYDAIRSAGVSIADLAGYPVPPAPDVHAAIAEVLACNPRGWRFDQLNHLYEVQDGLRAIEQARGGAALRAIESFSCDLRKLKRGSSPTDLVQKIKKELLPELEYSLITEHYAAERATIIEVLTRFDARYRDAKRQSGGLDYSDLEESAVRLLERHPEVRRRVQNQFDRVLMDEFQDTNGLQSRLLNLLRPPNRFFAVGDINQSIYGFRHADPGVFRAYRDSLARNGGRLVELVENFRSRKEILRAVEMVTAGAEGVERRALVDGLEFPAKPERSVEVIAAETPEAEAQWVASRILDLEGRLPLRRGIAAFRDFAVLLRNSEVMSDFSGAFDACGIPYLVNRGKGFYETREIVDLIHLLRVIVNPRDEISMAAVLRSPLVGVSDESLLRLKEQGNLGDAVQRSSLEFRGQLAEWRAARDSISIDQLLLRAPIRITPNVEKFLAQARAASARQSLAEFVDEIDLLRESQPREPDAPPEDSVNAVKIMTVHAAKGLEFPIVFLAAIQKGVDSDPGAISFSPQIGLGANWRHPRGDKSKSDSYRHRIKEDLKRREQEESNRLLYVAMTRAEEHLSLSFSTGGKKPQNWAARVVDALGCEAAAPRVIAPRAREVLDAAEQIVQPAVIRGQHDSQATVTSIALFAACPRRYYLSRYLGFESGAGWQPAAASQAAPPRTATDLGQQVHAILAGAPMESPAPEAEALAEIFRKSPLGKRAAAATNIEREFDFLMELEGIVLRGQIDLWFEERGKIILVDYKTDRIADPEPYELQLRLYATALEHLTGHAAAEAYLCFLRTNTTVPVDPRPTLFNSPEQAVREFREAQETQYFPLREGDHCRYCPHFKRLCPAQIASALPAVPTRA